MEELAKLSGFIGAHAIWSVSEGAALIPLMGYQDREGEQGLERCVTDRLEAGALEVQQWLRDNRHNAVRAVIAYDTYVTIEGWRTDAVLIESRDYDAGIALKVAVPYRHAGDRKGFAVYRPKFIYAEGADLEALKQACEFFFAGVFAHEEGGAVWDRYLDESR